MCMSVDLPEPDGPITAVRRWRSISSDTPRKRVDRRLALAVGPRDLERLR